MNTRRILRSFKEKTFAIKLKKYLARYFINNLNTRNKYLQDMTLCELEIKYGSFLDGLSKTVIGHPMEYSNQVWIFWRQGWDNAPDIVKACFKSVKRELNDRNIVFLTEENINEFITVPEFIIDMKEKGRISEAHYSDIIRISLLAEHGGLWLDATVFCTCNHMAQLMKSWPLFVFKTEDLDRTEETSIVCSNWLISSYKNNPFIITIRELLYEYWRRESYANDYFIFHLFVRMVKDRYMEMWKAIPVYNNISPHILAFEIFDSYNDQRYNEIKKMSDFHKLNHHKIDDVAHEIKIADTFYSKLTANL